MRTRPLIWKAIQKVPGDKRFLKRIRRTLKTSLVYAAGQYAGKAVTLLLVPVYTAVLLPADLGAVALVTIVGELYSVLLTSPIQSGFRRFYYAPEYKRARQLFLFNISLFTFFISVVLCLVYAVVGIRFFPSFIDHEQAAILVILSSVIVFFTPLTNICVSYNVLRERAIFATAVSVIDVVLSASITIVSLIVYEMGASSMLIGKMCSSLVCLTILLTRTVPDFDIRVKCSLLISPLKYGLPLVFSGLSNRLIKSGDRLILQYFSNSATVGLYSLGYNFGSTINFVIYAPVKKAMDPQIYQLEEDKEYLKQYLSTSANVVYFIGVFSTLILSFFGIYLFHFMVQNTDFYQAWNVVPLVAFCYVQHGLGNIVGKGVLMRRKSAHLSAFVLIAAVTNVVGNVLLIPWLGMLGAAWATLLSYIVWNSLKVYYSARFYGLHFRLKDLAMMTGWGFALYLLHSMLPASIPLWQNVAASVVMVAVYPLLVWHFGGTSQKDREWLRCVWKRIYARHVEGSKELP